MLMVDSVETSSHPKHFAVVALVGAPVQADRNHVGEQIVAEASDEGRVRAGAIVYGQGEGVFRVFLVGGFVYSAGLAPDHLAGRDERLAWRFRVFIELNTAVVFIRFGGEGEGINLVAELDGQLEERARALGTEFSRRIYHARIT